MKSATILAPKAEGAAPKGHESISRGLPWLCLPPSNKNQERSTMAPKAIPGPLKPAERDVKCLEHKIRIGVGDAHRRLNAERIPK